MTLTSFLKRAEKLVLDNSPTILTAVGVAGTLTTAYLTGTATYKAAVILEEAKRSQPVMYGQNVIVPPKEYVKRTWRLYIPAMAVGTVTVGAIIFANRVSSRRGAALAAAYTILEKGFEEYKVKVVEKVGERDERKMRDEMEQERIDRHPVENREVILTGTDDQLCFDVWSARYFQSDMESLRKAQNDVNAQVIHDGYATVADYYDMLGIPQTEASTEVGWNTDKLLELRFTGTLASGKKPCISVTFVPTPTRHYGRLR